MEKIKDMVFFAKEDTEGVKLSSTSANHIANLAKEYIQSTETLLNNMSFLDIRVCLISKNVSNTIQIGTKKEKFDSVPTMIDNIAQAKSLIAWLREAIKSKTALIDSLQLLDIDRWCEEVGEEKPKIPETPSILTKDEYYASLPVKERNRYYQLETMAAVIGKYIHPDGVLSDERKQLKDKIEHPHQVDGTGRDALIYTYTPSIDVADVDDTFYKLQKKHREVQAQLNSIKHECELAIEESTNKANTEQSIAIYEYQEKSRAIRQAFKMWKDKKSQEYSKLKIIIPNSLMEIYGIINGLGK